MFALLYCLSIKNAKVDIPVSLSDKFKFRCRQCGNCCRHVQASVQLEILYAFCLVKYLRDNDQEYIKCIDDVFVIIRVTSIIT